MNEWQNVVIQSAKNTSFKNYWKSCYVFFKVYLFMTTLNILHHGLYFMKHDYFKYIAPWTVLHEACLLNILMLVMQA